MGKGKDSIGNHKPFFFVVYKGKKEDSMRHMVLSFFERHERSDEY